MKEKQAGFRELVSQILKVALSNGSINKDNLDEGVKKLLTLKQKARTVQQINIVNKAVERLRGAKKFLIETDSIPRRRKKR